jgi:hypothetical protein
MIRSHSKLQTRLLNKATGQLVTDYNKMGARISEVPALLDPDLTIDKAKQIHRNLINSTRVVISV